MNRIIALVRTSLIAVLLMMGVAVALSPAGINAQEADGFSEGDEVIVIDGDLNLRQEPSIDAEVVTILTDATPLTILGGPESVDDLVWYQVITEDVAAGWVSSEFIAAAPVEAEFFEGDTVVVVSGPLNLRAEPGIDADIVATLEQAVEASILGGPEVADDLIWYQVNAFGGGTGWLAGEFLVLAAPEPVEEVEQFVFVTTDALNLRSEPTLDGEIAATLADGTVAILLDGAESADEIDWVQIASGEGDETIEGWVSAEFLSDPIVVGGEAEVVDGPLNLRGSTSLDAEILETLETGDTISVTGGPFVDDEFAWFEVQLDGQTGFVAGQFLGPVEEVFQG